MGPGGIAEVDVSEGIPGRCSDGVAWPQVTVVQAVRDRRGGNLPAGALDLGKAGADAVQLVGGDMAQVGIGELVEPVRLLFGVVGRPGPRCQWEIPATAACRSRPTVAC